jgi:hypothetical protein
VGKGLNGFINSYGIIYCLGVNGWLSERQAADLQWNRTVNLRGGPGHNIAMDKVNEFMNNEFKGGYTKTQVKTHIFRKCRHKYHHTLWAKYWNCILFCILYSKHVIEWILLF